MRTIIVLLLVVLSGCSTVPVTQKFPDAPEELLKACPELKMIEGNSATLTKLLETVTANYMMYHECSITHSAFIEWYKKQREIFEKVGKN